MQRSLPVLAVIATLALAGCDQPKPRPHAAQDGLPPLTPMQGPPMSIGLTRLPEFPGFYLDNLGSTFDPLTNPPATAAADAPVLFDGFAFDPVAMVPAGGVDVVVDRTAYGAVYGAPRGDVADFHDTPALVSVGYRAVLATGTLAPGPHQVVIRVIAADGGGFYESPVTNFEVK